MGAKKKAKTIGLRASVYSTGASSTGAL